ncbi:hypothetical protein [Halomonas sp.]|uniref:hypothetical protein n=1 Tax=Halomonas sp. TaxID=1486246 RepID=UPI003A1003C9
MHCPRCAQEAEASVNDLACPLCGHRQTRLTGGDELLLVSVDLAATLLPRPDNRSLHRVPDLRLRLPRPPAARLDRARRPHRGGARGVAGRHTSLVARHNREHFDRAGLLVVNLMSSPGAGKTSLLEATIEALGVTLPPGGDRGRPGNRERRPAHSCQGRASPSRSPPAAPATWMPPWCHRAAHALPLDELDILFIENVGNLVCPASFDLGQHANVTLLSTPEGDDKPLKYPVMFRASDLVSGHQTDLLAGPRRLRRRGGGGAHAPGRLQRPGDGA